MDPRHFFEVELPHRLALHGDVLPDGVVVSFEVADGGAWQLVAEAGRTRVEPRDGRPKDCEVRCAREEFGAMVRSPRAATRAYLTGHMNIVGDVGLLLRLQALLQRPAA
ncbi:MAG: SCP2 sterol-binding domain-containing protein [Deltaproteobacteria bacterium]|nr:SCP2 sterol-binding domain-containing protein [Deltaproteobacteria bacterium]